jgi:hypothetical protein
MIYYKRRMFLMSETTLTKTKRKTIADYEAIADQLLADMRHLETLMQADRIEIDRLKAEMHPLREEAMRLRTEMRAALSRLKIVFD